MLFIYKYYISILLAFVLQWNYCVGLCKFTNLQCFNFDKNYAEFTLCRLRAVKRDVNELTLEIKFLKMPLGNNTMRWQLLKKANGYKPFLYDVTVDVCDYLEKRNHPFVNIIFNTFTNYSTGVNKCPLSEKVLLQNFTFPEKALESLPLPIGEYAIFATFIASGIERGIVKTYFTLQDILAVQ